MQLKCQFDIIIMQSNFTIGAVLEVIDLIHHLKTECTPKELDSFVDGLASDRILINSLIRALQNLPIDNETQSFLCLYLSKALNLSDFGHFSTECYLSLLLNWRLRFKSKEMLVNGFDSLLTSVEEDGKETVFKVLGEMANLIINIGVDQTKARYFSQPIQFSWESPLIIQVDFPSDFTSLVQTYLIILQSILLNCFSLIESHQQRRKQLQALGIIKKVLLTEEQIPKEAELLSVLFAFYMDVGELVIIADPQQETVGLFLKEDWQGWPELTHHISIIYSSFCKSNEDGSYNYLECFPIVDKQLLALKITASEFHQLALKKLLQQMPEHQSLKDLGTIVPSVLSTLKQFSEANNVDGDQQLFVSNLTLLLPPFIQRNVLNTDQLVYMMSTYAVKLCEKALSLFECSSGQELHNQLSACLDPEDISCLPSASALLLSELFAQDDIVLKLFVCWFSGTLLKNQCINDIEPCVKAYLEILGPLSKKTLFFVAALACSQKAQIGQEIVSILVRVTNQLFLVSLESSQLQYFYFLAQTLCSEICQVEETRSALTVFAMQSATITEQFQYFGLSFLRELFEQFFEEKEVRMFISSFHLFQNKENFNLKWEVYHHLCTFLPEVSSETIVFIVAKMKDGAERELNRVLTEKSEKKVISYGEIKYYLGSLRKITKMLPQFPDPTPIIDALLDFELLIEVAGQLNEENELLLMAIDLIAPLSRQPCLRPLVIEFFSKLLRTFQRSEAKSWNLTVTLGRYLYLFVGRKFQLEEELLMGVLEQALQDFTLADKSSAFNQNYSQSILRARRVLFIVQKYLLWFVPSLQGPLCLALLQHCKDIITSFEFDPSKHSAAEGRLALQCRIVETILYLQQQQEVDFQRLAKYVALQFFDPYSAQLMVWLLTTYLGEAEMETKAKIVKLSVGIFVFSAESTVQTEDIYKSTKPKEDPFLSLHNKLQEQNFQQSLLQQVWVLFQKFHIQDQTDLARFSGLNPQILDLLVVSSLLQSLNQSSQRDELLRVKQKLINKMKREFQITYLEARGTEMGRTVWKISDNKRDDGSREIEHPSAKKRTFWGQGIDDLDQNLELLFVKSEEDGHPAKSVHFDHTKPIQYILIDDQEDRTTFGERRTMPDYSWSKLVESISYLAVDPNQSGEGTITEM